MVKNEKALISAALMICICWGIYFSFSGLELLESRSSFMLFPIETIEGYSVKGIIGSILFILSIILLVMGLKKYLVRSTVIAFFAFALLPQFFIAIYQETLADGIAAVSYDQNGSCDFESEEEPFVKGACTLSLKNRSNDAVTFELEFLDSFYMEEEPRMASLLNENGPYVITLEANEQQTISINEWIDVSAIPQHITGGSSDSIHIKLMQGKESMIL
jgi:hypothetical protein